MQYEPHNLNLSVDSEMESNETMTLAAQTQTAAVTTHEKEDGKEDFFFRY